MGVNTGGQLEDRDRVFQPIMGSTWTKTFMAGSLGIFLNAYLKSFVQSFEIIGPLFILSPLTVGRLKYFKKCHVIVLAAFPATLFFDPRGSVHKDLEEDHHCRGQC